MTHDRTRRHARARRIGALAGALLVLAAPASGVGERGPREPEQGRYLRLHAGPTEHLLSPGEAVRWEVEVALDDPPSAAEVAVAVGLSGSLLDVPGAMTLTLDWCAERDGGCSDTRALLPPTPADRLPTTPLEVAGAAGGRLVVTASVPPDAPAAAQGQQLRVAVDARAEGGDPAEPGTPAQPAPGRPEDPSGPATPHPPTPTAPSPASPLPSTGVDLAGSALLALAAVLTGATLAGLRRRVARSRGMP